MLLSYSLTDVRVDKPSNFPETFLRVLLAVSAQANRVFCTFGQLLKMDGNLPGCLTQRMYFLRLGETAPRYGDAGFLQFCAG